MNSWARRFIFGLAIMMTLNALRLAITWRAFRTNGMEQIGFPFVFFERGGFSYHSHWYYHLLAANVAIACALAMWFAHILRDGWTAAFHRIRTWGLVDSTNESSENRTEQSETIATEQCDRDSGPVVRDPSHTTDHLN